MAQKNIYKNMAEMIQSPIKFIENMWGLVPPEKTFIKGKHITHQQHEILKGIEKALNKEDKNRISVASGHGIGKSCCLAWILLWFLFTRKYAQVACTAPTSEQLHDVLWKEVKIWLDKMPEPVKKQYDWSNGYIRIVDSPETWFARARTARKENPEALAGVHGEHVLFLVDEASGVPEEIFRTAEGALTGENVLVIMISNYTRLIGYFHSSHTTDRDSWQQFQFNSEDSPIVDQAFVDRIEKLHGTDSDEYRVRVQGLPPKADAVDEKGYAPLFAQKDISYCNDNEFIGFKKMGVDPSGEGRDTTEWIIRDEFKAKIVCSEKLSSPKSIAQKTATLMKHFNTNADEVSVDNFGVGANVAQELGLIGHRINAVNVGERPESDDDAKRYLNKRAMIAWRLKDWIRNGGEFVRHDGWNELLNIRYRAELSGKMKLMGKEEMKKAGFPSPNVYDALVLTFLDEHWKEEGIQYSSDLEDFDRFELL